MITFTPTDIHTVVHQPPETAIGYLTKVLTPKEVGSNPVSKLLIMSSMALLVKLTMQYEDYLTTLADVDLDKIHIFFSDSTLARPTEESFSVLYPIIEDMLESEDGETVADEYMKINATASQILTSEIITRFVALATEKAVANVRRP